MSTFIVKNVCIQKSFLISIICLSDHLSHRCYNEKLIKSHTCNTYVNVNIQYLALYRFRAILCDLKSFSDLSAVNFMTPVARPIKNNCLFDTHTHIHTHTLSAKHIYVIFLNFMYNNALFIFLSYSIIDVNRISEVNNLIFKYLIFENL